MATPLRSIRVPDDIWTAVQNKAKAEGETATGIILKQLEKWLEQ